MRRNHKGHLHKAAKSLKQKDEHKVKIIVLPVRGESIEGTVDGVIKGGILVANTRINHKKVRALLSVNAHGKPSFSRTRSGALKRIPRSIRKGVAAEID